MTAALFTISCTCPSQMKVCRLRCGNRRRHHRLLLVPFVSSPRFSHQYVICLLFSRMCPLWDGECFSCIDHHARACDECGGPRVTRGPWTRWAEDERPSRTPPCLQGLKLVTASVLQPIPCIQTFWRRSDLR